MIYRLDGALGLLLWLAMLSALASHMFIIHPLLWLMLVAVGVWRWQVARGLWSMAPSGLVIIGLLVLMGWFFWNMGVGQTSIIHLLCTSMVFKFLEIRTKKDSILVVLIAMMITVVGFHDGAAWHNQLLILFLIFQLFLWFVLNRVQTLKPMKRSVMRFFGMMAMALPLTFLGLPWVERVTQWIGSYQSGLSGLSEQVMPGDMAFLRRNYQRVFVASFADKAPALETLYWRFRALDSFDGQRFTATEKRLQETKPLSENGVRYTVTLENPGTDIYPLDYFTGAQGDLFQRLDGSLLFPHRDHVSVTLSASHKPLLIDSTNASVASTWDSQGNTRASRWVQENYREGMSSTDFAHAILQYFHHNNFYYDTQNVALEPPVFDHMMFEARRGYCEHYAGLMVFLLRAANIPSRMVVGFLGGERLNQTDIAVRLADAHAWVEVFEDGLWHRFDPTTAIDPTRVLTQRLAPASHEWNKNQILQALLGLVIIVFAVFVMTMAWRKWLSYRNDQKIMKVHGVIKQPQETWRQFQSRLQESFGNYQAPIEKAFDHIHRLLYQKNHEQEKVFPQVRSILKTLEQEIR